MKTFITEVIYYNDYQTLACIFRIDSSFFKMLKEVRKQILGEIDCVIVRHHKYWPDYYEVDENPGELQELVNERQFKEQHEYVTTEFDSVEVYKETFRFTAKEKYTGDRIETYYISDKDVK